MHLHHLQCNSRTPFDFYAFATLAILACHYPPAMDRVCRLFVLRSSFFVMLRSCIAHLECENLVFQLADWLSLLESQALGGFLHGADHWRWATEKELNVIGWLGEVCLISVSTAHSHSKNVRTVIISGVTNPTPPSHFSGGLFKT